ncbi:MAG: hypothetical protein Ct9H300mP16_00890 [Pseudomonadota bacterium]|nr:MAG: hypothetical protein Ct9H300mP16_00890 [Pseudomonadota bacterium]
MDFQRLILFTGLARVLVLIWQAWIEYEGERLSPVVATERIADSGFDQNQSVSARSGSDAPLKQDVPSAPSAPTPRRRISRSPSRRCCWPVRCQATTR